MKLFILSVSIILIISCNRKEAESSNQLQQHHDSFHVAKRYTDSISSPKDELNERTIWQKPHEIIDLLGPLDQKVVADIGAGSGYFSFKFIHSAQKIIAIDIEKELIDLMNDELNYYQPEVRSKFEARLGKANDPFLKSSEVDIVFLSNTYCYIQSRVQYLKNLKNKFKPGGKIMIVDFKKKITPIGPDLKSRLAQGDVESELLDAGYKIILSDDTRLQYQYIIIAEIKAQ